MAVAAGEQLQTMTCDGEISIVAGEQGESAGAAFVEQSEARQSAELVLDLNTTRSCRYPDLLDVARQRLGSD